MSKIKAHSGRKGLAMNLIQSEALYRETLERISHEAGMHIRSTTRRTGNDDVFNVAFIHMLERFAAEALARGQAKDHEEPLETGTTT